MVKQDGLEWVEGTFGLEPRWSTDPRIEDVEFLARKHLKVGRESPCKVTFHAQGAFNKLYRIEANNSSSLMRVTLPVDPQNKTSSEVATIEFVRRNTDTPAAQIYAYDASSNNELGFEWILMEMLPGTPLRSKWRKLSIDTKRSLVEIIGDHITQDIPSGPFSSSYDWLHAPLRLSLNDQERILKASDDEDDIEDAEDAKAIVERLLRLLPQVFPIDAASPESTVLFHDDLSWQNILVDDDGNLTGVIDWECVSALPLWKACQIPTFLEGRDRNDEPFREQYSAEEDSEDDCVPAEYALDNEGVNSLYWEHLLEYEQTTLRRLFLGKMEELEPRWIEESEKGSFKADFEAAIRNCDNGFCFKKIRKWLELENGEASSLRSKLIE